MRLHALASMLVLLLAAPAAAGPVDGSAAPATARPAVAAEVLQGFGFDALFVAFGETLALAPRRQGVTDARFLAAWESAASTAFAGTDLTTRLETSLLQELAASELTMIGDFLASPLGSRIGRLERRSQAIAPEAQIAAIAKGRTLYITGSENRRAQLDELLGLAGADMTFAMLGESIRGMALGLHLAAHGELELPWDEIDQGVQRQLAGLHESLAEASRGAVALTYAELSEAELETYLAFLRQPATRRFHAVAGGTIGTLIRETMFSLGEDVAARLARVDI